MKVIIFFMAMTLSAPLHAVEPDKLLHAAGSFVINTALYTACINSLGKEKEEECFWIALTATLAVGAAKEFHDGANNSAKEHALDMTANGIGALSSGITLRIGF